MNILFTSPYQLEVWVSENGFVYDFFSGGPPVFVDPSIASELLANPCFTAV